ncbi:hypothetical protein PFISCL1PPCAC_1287, partial [Pristionchus fissidentatus]
NIILLSDHGLRNITERHALDDYDFYSPPVNSSAGNNVMFHGAIETDKLKCKDPSIVSDYNVYRTKEEVPLRYHYNTDRIGFPYIMGKPGNMFHQTREEKNKFEREGKIGNHGWDNFSYTMNAIFFAIGPSIAKKVKIPPFQNTELYNFFADLLNVPASPNDGTSGLLDELLLTPPTRQPMYDNYVNQPCDN